MKKIEVKCILGELNLSVNELNNLKEGQILQLETFLDEDLEISFNDKLKSKIKIIKKDGKNLILKKGDIYE